jgi:hypothetical protein
MSHSFEGCRPSFHTSRIPAVTSAKDHASDPNQVRILRARLRSFELRGSHPEETHEPGLKSKTRFVVYLTSESILNIGRYIEMMITPTIKPTPIIINGSMTLVSV